jgi:hypothetical protein
MNTILEVAIGLFFVFLIFSLLVSAVNEAVFGHLSHLRSRVLENGIHEILSKRASGFSIRACIHRKLQSPPPSNGANFSEQLLKHPLIQGLAVGSQRCPSYIPGETFVDAAVGTLLNLGTEPTAPAASPPSSSATIQELMAAVHQLADDNARKVFSSVLAGAADLEEARGRLETWFNNSMERVSGTYKRYSQFWLYVWATIAVVWLNIDSIQITQRLLTDAQFRSNLASGAVHFISQPGISNSVALTGTDASPSQSSNQPASGSALTATQVLKDAGQLNLPIGWGTSSNSATNSIIGWVITRLPILERATADVTGTNAAASLFTGGILASPPPSPNTPQAWRLKLLGLLITIAAISQGAPFWFDLLNRVTNLRAAGRPPQRRDDDNS